LLDSSLYRFFIASVIFLAACQGIGASIPLVAKSGASSHLVVFAAASLSDAFVELGSGFELRHSDVKVIFSFAGSQQLAHQLVQGAPADVIVSADRRQMEAVIQSGLVNPLDVTPFAHNRLVVVYPDGNPAGLEHLLDLTKPGIKLAIADHAVPAGQYAQQFLERASGPDYLGKDYAELVLRNVVSYEENIRAVLRKVQLGEVDGGITYQSYLIAVNKTQNGPLGSLIIPDELNILTSYYVAPLSNSGQKSLSTMFIAYLLSTEGQEILKHHALIPKDKTMIGSLE
jgi:molybdate transport system substrate-binding protein